MARRSSAVMKVTADMFADSIKKVLGEYVEETDELVEKAVTDTAEEAVKELKNVRQWAPGGHPTGKYSSSWSQDVQLRQRFRHVKAIYNDGHGQLTHLLEFGHAKVNGGRVAAYPHIAPVNEKLPEIFEKKLTEGLKE